MLIDVLSWLKDYMENWLKDYVKNIIVTFLSGYSSMDMYYKLEMLFGSGMDT